MLCASSPTTQTCRCSLASWARYCAGRSSCPDTRLPGCNGTATDNGQAHPDDRGKAGKCKTANHRNPLHPPAGNAPSNGGKYRVWQASWQHSRLRKPLYCWHSPQETQGDSWHWKCGPAPSPVLYTFSSNPISLMIERNRLLLSAVS